MPGELGLTDRSDQTSRCHASADGRRCVLDATHSACHVWEEPKPVDAVRVADVLAKLAVEVLEAERERTGVDEWDEADVRCYLYDAAYAWIENDPTRIPEFQQ